MKKGRASALFLFLNNGLPRIAVTGGAQAFAGIWCCVI
jgi:hypothetical protein